MPYFKVEPSGVCERKGLVQIRFCLYLESQDIGYEKHHVQIPIIPTGGYPGKIDNMGMPLDMENFKIWIDNLPKEWRDNPFHNHFILVPPETSDGEIADIGKAILKEAFGKWIINEKMDIKNSPVKFPTSPDKVKIEKRVTELKSKTIEGKL